MKIRYRVVKGFSKKEVQQLKALNEIESVANWGINIYILKGAGFYPDFKSSPGNLDFFATKEYFGAGGFTVRATIISQKFYQLLVKNKVKGLSYEPMTC